MQRAHRNDHYFSIAVIFMSTSDNFEDWKFVTLHSYILVRYTSIAQYFISLSFYGKNWKWCQRVSFRERWDSYLLIKLFIHTTNPNSEMKYQRVYKILYWKFPFPYKFNTSSLLLLQYNVNERTIHFSILHIFSYPRNTFNDLRWWS